MILEVIHRGNRIEPHEFGFVTPRLKRKIKSSKRESSFLILDFCVQGDLIESYIHNSVYLMTNVL
jgi:hypothetical protein